MVELIASAKDKC